MKHHQRGFTLLEIMIVIAIVGILSAIALPQYTQHTMRTRLSSGFSALASAEIAIENYWSNQSPRTYADFDRSNRLPSQTPYFKFEASNLSATTYTIKAIGLPNTRVDGFVYSIDQTGLRKTDAVPSGWTASATCWVDRKGGLCTQ